MRDRAARQTHSRRKRTIIIDLNLWLDSVLGKRYYLLVFGMCLLLCGFQTGLAQDIILSGELLKTIRRVRVEGNTTIPDSKLLSQVRSRPDSVFDEKQVSEDARRLIIMPEIYDVKWKALPVEDQIDLVFTVVESPRIDKVMIMGNKNIKTDKLSKELKFKEGDFLDLYQIQLGSEALRLFYHKEGYYFATVTLNEEELQKQRQVIYTIVEGPRVRIKKIHFQGNQAFPNRKLKSKIKTNAYFPIFNKGRLDDDQLDMDRQALMTFYHQEGYLDARVFVQKEYNPDKTRLNIRFVIEEGIVYRVASIRFEGNQNYTQEQLLASIKLEPEQILTNKRQVFAQRAVEQLYGREGYIYTRVRIDLEYTDQEGEVNVVFNIVENEKYLLGRLIVRGNYQTRDKVIRRDFSRHGFDPGNIYNTEAADKGKRRLGGSGLFENITVIPTGTEPGIRDALVEIKETRTGLILMGVGVDTNSGVMGQFSIEQRNFDASKWPKDLGELFRGEAFVGGGQTLRLDFRPGTKVTTGRIQFHEPYLYDTPYYLDTNLFMFRRWRESYLERRRGGNVSLGRRFDNDWSIEGSLRVERVLVSDLDYKKEEGEKIITAPPDVQEVEGKNLLTSVKMGIGQNTTDRMFMPTEGHKLNLSWEQVGAMGGEYYYGALSAGLTLYRTIYMDITERRTVWAGQIRGNKIVGDAPVFERYYVGGIGSLRGFDYRGVSPRGGVKDDPIGSNYVFLANTEITHPIVEETIYGKIFCDSGFVSEGPYRVTLGFGLQLVVPQLFQMIPMHFDFGIPIISDDKDDEQVFSFTFGMNF
ncbi:MAG: outer membrane protein assembly factor BamA [Sedimentisphaerales bacterium]|nr:outer membrane protein assembly factor BamA [Sedimentisphaerales bacterium]